MTNNASFVQDRRHDSKSERFTAIQPAQFAMVLADHGFNMVGLKASRAKLPDRAEHQTTIARYRSERALQVNGLNLDIMIKAPHLYGSVEFRLGFFRGACANQWNMGQLFATYKLRHTADYLERANQIIPSLLGQCDTLTNTIHALQSRQATAGEVVALAQATVRQRLEGVEGVSRVHAGDLVRVRRADDDATDLFSVSNVIQENAIRYGFRYEQTNRDERGYQRTRHLTTRAVNEASDRAVALNASIWDEAAKLLEG